MRVLIVLDAFELYVRERDALALLLLLLLLPAGVDGLPIPLLLEEEELLPGDAGGAGTAGSELETD